jgi:hypothetical protein
MWQQIGSTIACELSDIPDSAELPRLCTCRVLAAILGAVFALLVFAMIPRVVRRIGEE